jgi:hypothetical protein
VVKTKRPFQRRDCAYSRNPRNLPQDVLFRDYTRGQGEQEFAVKLPTAIIESCFSIRIAVSLEENLRAQNGRLVIPFPVSEWYVSGLIVQGSSPGHSYPRLRRARRSLRGLLCDIAHTSAWRKALR